MLRIVAFADRFVVLQLLKHHRATAGGRSIVRLGGTQRAVSGKTAGEKAHQATSTLLTNSHHFWQPVQLTHHQLTTKPARRTPIKEIKWMVEKSKQQSSTTDQLENKEIKEKLIYLNPFCPSYTNVWQASGKHRNVFSDTFQDTGI